MFVQNIIKLSAAVHELSWSRRKKSDEENTIRRYRADSNKMGIYVRPPSNSIWPYLSSDLVREYC